MSLPVPRVWDSLKTHQFSLEGILSRCPVLYGWDGGTFSRVCAYWRRNLATNLSARCVHSKLHIPEQITKNWHEYTGGNLHLVVEPSYNLSFTPAKYNNFSNNY